MSYIYPFENVFKTFSYLFWSETSTGYELYFKVPGFKKSDIKVTRSNGTLKLVGKSEKWGEFVETLSLPSDGEVRVKVEDGILHILLETKASKARDIPVE